MSTCFEGTETGLMQNPTGQLEHLLYGMVVRLVDSVANDLSPVLVGVLESEDEGVMITLEDIDGAIQCFTRATQVLLWHVLSSEGKWDEPQTIGARLESWKRMWYAVARLLLQVARYQPSLRRTQRHQEG